jgi:hypothetical protein
MIFYSYLPYWMKLEADCNTLCYSSSNLTLIIIISGLVLLDATGLINSEPSQWHFLFKLNLNHQI